ncbi:MAG: hypothetical protein AB8I08_24620 [Sandaracinaceae bacterium]
MTGSRLASHVLLFALSVPLFGGCAALRDDMQRAEQSYDAARYEDALIWFRDLETDAPSMDDRMRARYFYLRGMTEYRLGHRLQALHYLAVAREIAGEDDVGLRPEWRQIMDRTLTELTPRTMTHRPPAAAEETADQAATAGGEAETPEAPPTVDAES